MSTVEAEEVPIATATTTTVKTTVIPPSEETSVVPMGDASKGTPSNPGGGSIRGLVIGIVTLDAISLACWCVAWAVPFLGFVTLATLVIACILALVIPCLKKEGLTDGIKRRCTGVFVSHLVTLVLYIVAVALAGTFHLSFHTVVSGSE